MAFSNTHIMDFYAECRFGGIKSRSNGGNNEKEEKICLLFL